MTCSFKNNRVINFGCALLVASAMSQSPTWGVPANATKYSVASKSSQTIIKDSVHLTALVEDMPSADNSGIRVSSLLTNAVAGAGSLGMAVVFRDHENGTWQFLENGIWWNFDRYATASAAQSLLLPSTAEIRFNPGANFTGKATFTYRAWDESSGTAYMLANTSTNGINTAFSAETGVASIFVSSVNDAPDINSSIGIPVIAFDGANDHISFADASLSGDFTMEAWINVTQHQTWSRVIDIGTGQGNNNILMGFEGGTNKIFMSTLNGGAGSNLYVGSAFPTNVWKHVACVNNGSGTGLIYVDGVLIGSGNQVAAPVAVRNNNFVAKSNWGQDSYFNGSMREIRIWDVARTASQIQSNMNVSLQGYEPGLKVYYRTDEGAGPVAKDASKSNLNGSLNNGALWKIFGSPLKELTTKMEIDAVVPGFQTLDPDAGTTNVTFKLTATSGVLKFKDNILHGLVASHISGNGTKSVTITAPANQIDTTLEKGGFIYSPDAGFYGKDKVLMDLTDNGASGVGGKLDDAYSFDVLVLHVPQPLPTALFDTDSINTCASKVIGATLADPNFTYSWNTGATTSAITAEHNGWYKLAVSDGIQSIADSIHVGIIKAKILNTDVSICKTSTPGSYSLAIDSSAVGTNITLISQLSANLQNGLIGYYTFNGSANELKFGGTGNGVISNATATTNRFGFTNGAMAFLKASQSGVVTGKLLTTVSNNFTYSVYVNPSITTALPPTQTIASSGIFGTQCVIHPTHGADFGAEHANAGSGLYVGTNGLYVSEHSTGYVATPLVYTGDLSGWHMITIVYDNKVPKLYIDGLYVKSGLVNTRTIWPSMGYDPTTLGNYSKSGFGAGFAPGGGGQYFSGSLDDIAYYSRPLSSSDVAELYFGLRNVKWSTQQTTKTITVLPVKDTTYRVSVSNGFFSCEDEVSFTYINPKHLLSGNATMLKAKGNNAASKVDTTIAIDYTNTVVNASVTLVANQQPEDVLDVTAVLPTGASKSFDAVTGVLSIAGSFTATELETIFRTVTFATTSKSTLERKVTFSLGSAVPSANGHFYEYISSPMSWDGASAAAAARNMLGKQGYLATISDSAENAYIRSKLTGDGWIGMSDDYVKINAAVGATVYSNQGQSDGNFFWVTGPETGSLITVGNFNPVTQSNKFGNWNPGEPNGANGAENFTQLYANGKWNDLPNTSSIGYVVEYGGLTNDPCETTTFTRSMLVKSEPPVITANQTFSLDENARAQKVVATIVASSTDANVVFSNWTITAGNIGNAFSINPATGVITVSDSTALDYETRTIFNLSVTVSDGFTTSAVEVVKINLNNLNDSPPVIAANQVFNINENSAKGAAVGTISAMDPDGTTTFKSWKITGGNTDNAFSIDSVSGAITVNDSAALDYEKHSIFNLTIAVSDGLNTSTQLVKVKLNDLNDSAPVITANQSFTIDENTKASTIVGTVIGSDADTDGEFINWTITSGNIGNAFTINPATGEISVNDSLPLNFELNSIFKLYVSVGDKLNTSEPTLVSISLNNLDDNSPIVTSNQVFTIDENSINGTLAGAVIATDADGATVYTNWQIIGGNTNDAFTIDPITGVITVNESTILDYESVSSFDLVVRTSDGLNTSAAKVVRIKLNNLNDSPPIVVAQNMRLDENSSKNASPGMVTIDDSDGNSANNIFSIVGGNIGSAFMIDPVTGVITVADSSEIDFEKNPMFYLVISAFDGVNTSAPKTIKVDLTDLNDNVPEITSNQSFTINENSRNNTMVGMVTTTDGDEGTTYSNYTIIGGNVNGAFRIDPITGVISVNDSTQLDFEVSSTYLLEVAVSDGLNLSAAQTVKIMLGNLNDTAPVISENQNFTTDENTTNGMLVGKVEATDADGNTNFSNWVIVGGNTNNAFSIDSITGIITVRDSSALDYEMNSTFNLEVMVMDSLNTSQPQVVKINLGNLNDTPPVIAYNQKFAVDENSAKNKVVGTLVATDADGNTSFSPWVIIYGNIGNAFSIDSLTGVITVNENSEVDFEKNSSFFLLVTVGDGKNVSDMSEVIIDVNNLNDVAPVITSDLRFSTDENSSSGSIIGTATAIDDDGSTTFKNWTIVSGNTGNAFDINPLTGVISIKDSSAIDFEKNPLFNLLVSVSDGTLISSTETITIYVNNRNDIAPVLTSQVFIIDEGTANGTRVGAATISDEDGATNYTNWKIVGGNTNNAFYIDPLTGMITVYNEAAVDYLSSPSFVLMVTATDGVNTSKPYAVTIKLNNLNNIAPVITTNQQFTVKENETKDATVGTVTVADKDGSTSYSNWTITGGNTDNAFSIDPVTGAIKVNNPSALNYERNQTFTLTITTTDGIHVSEPTTIIINLGDNMDGIIIYSAFSPNYDGMDDRWVVDGLQSYPKSEVKIFNTDGHELFANVGYTEAWDGTHNGKVMPVGSYYYIIKLNDGSNKVYNGALLIIK